MSKTVHVINLAKSTRLDLNYQLELRSLDRSLIIRGQVQVQVGVKGH
jgi:hypothetical protein